MHAIAVSVSDSNGRQTKDFVKFLSLVVILYFGFLTTFTLLGRDHFTSRQMSWILVKVFFGSSYLGFVCGMTAPQKRKYGD